MQIFPTVNQFIAWQQKITSVNSSTDFEKFLHIGKLSMS